MTVLFLVALWSGAAHADPTAAEKETARALMAEGRSRRDHEDLRGALESFRAADALMHVATTGLEVARAEAALGQLVEARDTLRQVARIPSREGEPKPFVEARLAAQSLDDELAARVPAIRIAVRGEASEGATVTIDGVPVPVAARLSPYRVNPGRHVVAVLNGGSKAQAAVDVAERAVASVVLDVPHEGETEAARPPDDAGAGSSGGGAMRVVALGGFGLAGAGIALGTITGVMSLSATSRARDQCVDDRCPRSVSDDLDRAHTLATVSTIAFAAGAAGLALGAIGLVVGGKHSPPATAAATTRTTGWAFAVGPLSAGIKGRF